MVCFQISFKVSERLSSSEASLQFGRLATARPNSGSLCICLAHLLEGLVVGPGAYFRYDGAKTNSR